MRSNRSASRHGGSNDEISQYSSSVFRRELDAACEVGGLFQLTLHPHIIAARSRIWILDELLRHAAAHGAWFATHRDFVAHARSADRGITKEIT